MSVLDLPDVCRRLGRTVASGHYAGYRLARTAIISRYYRSAFGLVWEFAEPIVIALVFIFLRQSRALPPGEIEVPYAVFVLAGVMMWKTFTQALNQAVSSMADMARLRGGLIVKPEAAMLSVLYENVFALFFRLVILLAVVGWYGMLDPLSMLKFFLALPLVLISALGVGFILAPFNLVYRDIGRATQTVIWPLMFLSGVVIALPDDGPMGMLRVYNPTAILIYNLRELLLLGTLDHVLAFAVFACVSLVAGVAGWYIYRVTFDMAGEVQ